MTKKTEFLAKKLLECIQTDFDKKLLEEISKLKAEILQIIEHDDTFLTKKEVCSIFKISESTVEKYIRNGLKFHSKSRCSTRKFKRSEVEEFLNLKSKKNGR